MTPFAGNTIPALVYVPVNSKASTATGSENYSEDNSIPCATSVCRLRESEAVRVVFAAHLSAESGGEIALQGLPLSHVELAFLTRPDGRTMVPGMATPTEPC